MSFVLCFLWITIAINKNIKKKIIFVDSKVMKATSIEIKKRIVELREENGLKYKEIAFWLGVTHSVVKKVLLDHRKGVSLVPGKPGPKGQRTFSAELIEEIRDYVTQNKDATLEQIQGEFSHKVSCTIPTFHRLLARLGFRYNKNLACRRAR